MVFLTVGLASLVIGWWVARSDIRDTSAAIGAPFLALFLGTVYKIGQADLAPFLYGVTIFAGYWAGYVLKRVIHDLASLSR